eukprot:ctg_1307.g426
MPRAWRWPAPPASAAICRSGARAGTSTRRTPCRDGPVRAARVSLRAAGGRPLHCPAPLLAGAGGRARRLRSRRAGPSPRPAETALSAGRSRAPAPCYTSREPCRGAAACRTPPPGSVERRAPVPPLALSVLAADPNRS